MKFVRATHTGSWASDYPLAYSLEEGGQVHLSRTKLEGFLMPVGHMKFVASLTGTTGGPTHTPDRRQK